MLNKKIMRAAGLALLAVAAAACTADKPTKLLLKDKVESKGVIGTGKYLYLPSVGNTDKNVQTTIPYLMGNPDIVELRWTENALQVVALERDARFADNKLNDKPLLKFPVEHLDYKCSEDAYGDCTNQEQFNEEVTWNQRGFFKPNYEDTEFTAEMGLPVISQVSSGTGCYRDAGAKLIDAEFGSEAINIEIERSFTRKLTWVCLLPLFSGDYSLDSLKQLTFTARYQFSLVPLEKAVSADYETIEYTRTEEGLFGFFPAHEIKVAVDNRDNIDSEKMLVKRFNPKKSVIKYYLTRNFLKPENKPTLIATEEAVRAINNAFDSAMAGSDRKIRVETEIAPEGVKAGDLRYNMIVLVEDPNDAGVLGYGPSAENPLTGEIVKANTVIFAGVMKQIVKREYDHIVKELIAEEAQKQVQVTLAPQLQIQNDPQARKLLQQSTFALRKQLAEEQPSSAPRKIAATHAHDFVDLKAQLKNLERLKDASNQADLTTIKKIQDRIESLSKINAYPAELFNAKAAIISGAKEVVKEVGLKPYESLTESEKERVVSQLLPYALTPTIIHEIGHNLGLRHNFAGSEDKANFYSTEELEKMGVQEEWLYSSVMDYGYRTTKELKSMGKYDIAALRYGYAEQLELAQSDQLISLKEFKKTLDTDQLKIYDYCTDEHADINPNCNRFDEGTNLIEITEHLIDAYHDLYELRNYRDNRRSFSLLADASYYGRIGYTFHLLRLSYERYETIVNQYQLPPDSPQWESIPFLKELRTAAQLAGLFFMDVIKTPELTCAVASIQDPTTIVGVLPLQDLTPVSRISCFDPEVEINPQFVIVGEYGKSFASLKDANNPNPYADQIDLRGVWIDKLLATEFLLKREFDSIILDRHTQNFFAMPELQQPIIDTLVQVVTDTYVAPIEIRLRNGAKQVFPIRFATHDSHVLHKPMNGFMTYLLNLPSNASSFRREFLQTAARELNNINNRLETQYLTDVLGVTTRAEDPGRIEEYRAIKLGATTYYALPENQLSLMVMSNLQASSILSQIPQERLQELLALLQTGDEAKEAELTEIEKQAIALGPEIIVVFLNGLLKSPSYYTSTLRDMAEATERGARVKYSPADILSASFEEALLP